MENLDSIYNVVQQSSSNGISAIDIALKLGKKKDYRTTVTRYLDSLETKGAVRSDKGKWVAKDNFNEVDLDNTKIRLFKYIVEHGDSPIIQGALSEIEGRILVEHIENSIKNKRDDKKSPKELMDLINNLKTKALLKFIEQLDFEEKGNET